ncbi:MAG: SUMF1/EgtB/PvdO family nonheme iron enzyme [Pseudomonadota bacterium]|nr:SUMF1/EgtB/PvdO family nonheme iron enzyme [Pseudomonadota bacterium]
MRLPATTTAFLLALAALLLAVSPAHAEKRVALVIGNSTYAHVGKLANPANDASAVAESLKRLGFESVEQKSDLDYRAFRKALSDFSRIADGADVALIYYAGHGIEVDKRNYLIPVDAELRDGRDADLEALPLDVVMGTVEGARKLRLVVLDACRDNPFRAKMASRGGTRSIGRGLARVEAPSNTLVAFAAREGTTADDGRGKHSPYTTALLKHIETPGLEINFLFRRVRDAVLADTGGRQEPFIYGSLSSEAIFLKPGDGSALPTVAAKEDNGRLAAMQKELEALKQQLDKKPEAKTQPKDDGKLAALQAEVERLKKQLETKPEAKKPEEPKTKVAVGTFEQQKPTTPARGLKPGDEFQDCDTCPKMVVIPAGSFTMGSHMSEPQRGAEEGQQRRVTIDRPFAAGKFEVTFAEWDACAADGGCDGHRPGDQGWGRGNRPVVDVSWLDAKTYVAWLSRKTGKEHRLLSEAEWEYAARAGTTTPFSTGQTITTVQANFNGDYTYNGSGKGQYRKKTTPVGSFAANAFGLHDMHGNVWEWVEDCWNGSYAGASTDRSARTAGDCSLRVLRGGSWSNGPWDVRSAIRYRRYTDNQYTVSGIGFRVARDLTPEELGK